MSSYKNCTESNKQISKQIRKKRFFVGILEVTGEKEQDPDPDL